MRNEIEEALEIAEGYRPASRHKLRERTAMQHEQSGERMRLPKKLSSQDVLRKFGISREAVARNVGAPKWTLAGALQRMRTEKSLAEKKETTSIKLRSSQAKSKLSRST